MNKPKFREKELSPLIEFFLAQRFNIMFYLAGFLGWVAYVFALLSYYTEEILPGLAEVFEWRADEFIAYSESVRTNMIRWTMLDKYEDIEGASDGN